MNNAPTLCAFYSHGPHFRKVLQELRAQYPQDRILALIPPGYPSVVIRDLVDDYEFTQYKRYRGSQIGALYQLRKQIRAHRPALFVVMFDSTRLRLLGALSGVRERYCISPRGKWTPLRISPHRQALHAAWNRLVGAWRYHWVRYHVYHRSIPKQALQEGDAKRGELG